MHCIEQCSTRCQPRITHAINSGGIHHVVGQCGVGLSTTSQSTERVEHSRTQETDKSDHQKLHLRRSIPGDIQSEDTALSVFPSGRQSGVVEVAVAIAIVVVDRSDMLVGGPSGLFVGRHDGR